MRPQQRGGLAIAACGLLLLLLSVATPGVASVIVGTPPGDGGDGAPFVPPAAPDHVWVAGDVFSLHGTDAYRYIVVYTRNSGGENVHGVYEVERDAAGAYTVATYVHGQEVFADSFIAEQGGRFIENVPLDAVTITDQTPANSGRIYAGMTLGSIYGAANAPVATPTPGPTAPHWPSVKPTAAPTGVVSVTRTPGPDPTVPDDAEPFPMPTVDPAGPVPTVTPTGPATEPTGAPGWEPGSPGPVLEPTPVPEATVTSSTSRAWGRRLATWQAPSLTGRRLGVAPEPAVTVQPGTRPARALRAFARFYPPWYRFPRTATAVA